METIWKQRRCGRSPFAPRRLPARVNFIAASGTLGPETTSTVAAIDTGAKLSTDARP
jgi:hypothetical protein